jgi:hypothetical protein
MLITIDAREGVLYIDHHGCCKTVSARLSEATTFSFLKVQRPRLRRESAD